MNNLCLKIFILIIYSICFELSLAQNIAGYVRDSTHCVLPYATISADDNKYIAISDQNGYYELKNVGAGNHIIKVSFLGYSTHRVEVDCYDSQNVWLEVLLMQQLFELDDVIVSQDGIINYIMSRVVNRPDLKDILSHRKEEITFRLESTGNLDRWPKNRQRLMRSGLAVVGMGKYFDCCVNHPNLVVHLSKTNEIDKRQGYSESKASILDSSDSLTINEKTVILDKFGDLSADYYTTYYHKLKKMYSKYQKAYKKGMGDDVISYIGSYKENGRTIYRLKSEDTEFHIVDDCFQLRRFLVKSADHKEIAEFGEILPDLYLPISRYHSTCLDMEANQKWTWNESTTYIYCRILK